MSSPLISTPYNEGFVSHGRYSTIFASLILLFLTHNAWAVTPEDLVEHRYTATVERNADGTIRRSAAVVRAFRKAHPCPSTGLTTGACPNWSVDHVLPLASCGRDAVDNLQWLPNSIKSCPGTECKDRFERRIYQCPK